MISFKGYTNDIDSAQSVKFHIEHCKHNNFPVNIPFQITLNAMINLSNR